MREPICLFVDRGDSFYVKVLLGTPENLRVLSVCNPTTVPQMVATLTAVIPGLQVMVDDAVLFWNAELRGLPTGQATPSAKQVAPMMVKRPL